MFFASVCLHFHFGSSRPTAHGIQEPLQRGRLGDGAVNTFMGGRPEDVPERYALCDPHALVPDPGSRRVLLHGSADIDVPLAQSQDYLEHLVRHDLDAELIVIPGDGHYEILDPLSEVSGLRRGLLADALRP